MSTLTVDPDGAADADAQYAAFAAWVDGQGITLYPAQDEAVLELVTGTNVVLATPTGSGKSLVAVSAHYFALARGVRSVYTAPIKALVSEKFFALCAVFGSENVGMLTGDATVNGDAPILCCTAEILANIALRTGAASDLAVVIMDEFHFYADPERGWAWQVPLLELTRAQFLLMSATLGDTREVADDLARRTGRPTVTVAGAERPVPLHHYYAVTSLHETITDLLAGGQAPIYVVHFTQAAALEQAQSLTSINVASRAERDVIAETIGGFRFTAGFGKVLSRLVRHGIGVHHAGMLPKYRRLVEQLAQAGLLKVICGTDTLGVGINVPIRTVVFAALSKYDGTRQRQLQAREFQQISGRAGRAGFDTAGTVVVQAPEHEVENARLLARAGDDEKKKRRIVRKKPPDGFVSWGRSTHDRLQNAAPEALVAQFAVTPAMVLNVIARPGDAFATMRNLIMGNHSTPSARRAQVRAAIRAYRALLAAGVIERLDTPDETGRTVRLTADLPLNFALNQPLSTFALAALDLLDRDSDEYALDVVSVFEATLDDPRQILRAQEFRARGEAVAAMKAEGVEYEERLELLDGVTWPRPLADLLHGAFAIYRRSHPWLTEDQLAPKSVVRDMWERAMTFTEYVAFYGLTRSEGLVLRYLSDAYRTLRSSVPDAARTEGLDDLTEWLGALVRQVDSSLLDEWEQLTAPDPMGEAAAPVAVPVSLTGNVRAFTVLVRNALFRRVELAALRRYAELGELDAAGGWDADRWRAAIEAYYAEYDRLPTDADARNPALLHIERAAGEWFVRQVFDDPAGDHDWGIRARIGLDASDEAGEPAVTVLAVGPYDQT
ncbi:DEAD/DEAH box helicase [uncultured Jatrophihabitans sp.]|uniref:DEAD/DEAH box helicase n=1 Tax=uncultured Jatrophihabitans sp. TaxID=1610747 RepID=UPI0035CB1D7F